MLQRQDRFAAKVESVARATFATSLGEWLAWSFPIRGTRHDGDGDDAKCAS